MQNPPIIIGAGIAGASLAQAFRRRGVSPIIIEPEPDLLSAASGNPAAMVMPRLDLQDRPESRFFLNAFQYAVQAYDQTGHVLQTGAFNLAKTDEEMIRFEKLAAQSPLPSSLMQLVSRDEASSQLGIDITLAYGGLYFPCAKTIDPKSVIKLWTSDAQIKLSRVARIKKIDQQYLCLDENDALIGQSDTLFITLGAEILTLETTREMPVCFTRGQLSWGRTSIIPHKPVTYGGYALAFQDGVLLGATHEHVGPGQNGRTRAADDIENAALYNALTGQSPAQSKWQSRASCSGNYQRYITDSARII